MSETRTIHDAIAADAFAGGGWLRCEHPGCDRVERITRADVARYLAHSWPTHHGLTMTYSIAALPSTPDEADQ